MEIWIIVSVLSTMFLTWLFSRLVLRIVTHVAIPGLFRDGRFASAIADFFSGDGLSWETIRERLLTPEAYQKLLPQVEEHVDHFLKVRLKEEMPVVGMMVGDRTIAQMKGIFLKELETLFPEVMAGYFGQMKSNFNPGQLLKDRLSNIPKSATDRLSEEIIKSFSARFQLLAIGAGLLIGIIQVSVFFLLRP